MYKKIQIIIFITLTFVLATYSQNIPLTNSDGSTHEWNTKMAPLLKIQLNVKNSVRQNQQKLSLESFENMGFQSEDPDNQLVYIYFREYPSSAQLMEIEKFGATVYPDSWIPPVGAHPYGYMLVRLALDNINHIAGYDFIRRMDTAEKNFQPKNDNATANIHASNVWQAGYTGNGVLIGVLDSGLDSNFADFPALTAGIDYSAYPLTDSNIENTVTGHGTHVTGSVLGRGTLSGGQYRGSAPDAGLVFYKIGSDASGGASTAAITNAMRDAVDNYGVDIITMSYGGWDEYHDGSAAEDQAVDYAVSQGATVFISAGNSGNDGWHYSGTVAAGSSTGYIQVNITGAGIFSTYLAFNLVWDDGDASNVLDLNFYNSSLALLGKTILSSQNESIRGTESEYSRYSSLLPVNNSTYYLQVVNSSASDQDFHLYYYSGLNSSNAGIVEFQNPDPNYTIGTPATADSAIAVGAHVSRKYWTNYLGSTYSYSSDETVDDIASFSSRGPRIDGFQKPTITAPGSAIISAKDPVSTTAALTIDNDGIYNDGLADYYVMQGTSMACPIAAGTAALLLQYDPTLKPWQIRNLLINNTDNDSYTGILPNSTWGYGKLNIENALEALLPGAITSQTITTTGLYSFSGTDVSIDFSSSGSDGYVSVSEINNLPYGGTSNVSGGLDHISSIRYWQIESDKSGFNASVTFSYDPSADVITDENTLLIAHRESEAEPWTEYADITRNPASDQITANNVTQFSQWIFASGTNDNPLPVELSHFNYDIVNKQVNINWTTASEIENFGFNLYRAEKQDDISPAETEYVKINDQIIAGAGNSSEQHDYSFTDENVEYDKTYLYRLEDISFSGEINQSENMEVFLKAPLYYALNQNYPNPFNPQTQIEYQITDVQHVMLKVYDITGKEITTLVNQQQDPGQYTVSFDASGLAGGIYIYQIYIKGSMGSFIQNKKMLLLK